MKRKEPIIDSNLVSEREPWIEFMMFEKVIDREEAKNVRTGEGQREVWRIYASEETIEEFMATISPFSR